MEYVTRIFISLYFQFFKYFWLQHSGLMKRTLVLVMFSQSQIQVILQDVWVILLPTFGWLGKFYTLCLVFSA